MTVPELQEFLEAAFPGIERRFVVEDVDAGGVRIRVPFQREQLRPGGTISGPTMMALADTCAYLAILAQIGPEALTVTTSLHIDFLRRPAAADLVGDARLLKLGRRLAVVSVGITSEGAPDLVAQANITYSIPPWAT